MNEDLAALLSVAKGLNEDRLALDRQSNELKKKYQELVAEAIALMKKNGITFYEEGDISADLSEIQKPFISNWTELNAFIKEHDATDLLQKRLTESAVKLRWDDGIVIPGIGLLTEDKLVIK